MSVCQVLWFINFGLQEYIRHVCLLLLLRGSYVATEGASMCMPYAKYSCEPPQAL